jgi:general secretion pathway protein B
VPAAGVVPGSPPASAGQVEISPPAASQVPIAPALPRAPDAPARSPEPSAPFSPAAAVPEPPPPVPEAPPPDGRILELTELPIAILSQIPPITISGHVWSEDPTLRMLTVDDQVVKEGGRLSAGVRLDEITSDGAVFSYQGYRFRVAGF